MNWIIDIILVAIIVTGIVLGLKRGFVKTVAKPVKLVATWACSIKLAPWFAKRFIAPLIQAPVTEKLSAVLREKCQDLTAANAAEDLPTLLKICAGIFNINVEEVAQGSVETLTDRIAQTFTEPLVSVVAVVISFFLLLIICSILFAFLLWLLNLIFELRPFAWLNRTLGVLFGAALAMIVTWIVSMILGYVFGLSIFDGLAFEGGFVYRFFQDYHPLDLLLGF